VTEQERGPGATITYGPSSLTFIEMAPRFTQLPERSMRSWSL
jgi:hypothetical protein